MPATGNKSLNMQSLSIRVAADGFSFFVCDSQVTSLIRGQHFRLPEGENLAEKLRHELGKSDYFHRGIDQVFVVMCTPSTRLPLEAFRRDEAAALYDFTFSATSQTPHRVSYNILPQLEVVELFAVPVDVEEAILQYYPMARFFGQRAMLLERLLHYEETTSATASRLYLFQESARQLTLISFAEGHLHFANTFSFESPTDALYYVLAVWRQLEFDAQTDELMLLNSSDANQEAFRSQLMQYILRVTTLTPSDLFPRVSLAGEKEIPLDLMALLLNRI